jgi:Ca-activated chloride channel homolog
VKMLTPALVALRRDEANKVIVPGGKLDLLFAGAPDVVVPPSLARHSCYHPRTLEGTKVRAVLLGGMLAVLGAAGAAAQQGRFTGRIDLVNVPVMVLDRQGNFISNLAAGDFEVLENGQRQDVKVFVRGDSERDALNLRLGLLLDTSGSMLEDMGLASTAAIRFLKDLPEAQDITLVDFDTEVRVAQYGTADLPRLVERIRSRKADGWTSLYDALGIYLDGAHDMDGRKVLVIYTDGGDTRSAQTFTDVMAMLKSSDVIVYTIGFLEHQPLNLKSEQRMRLQQLADVTGGEAFFPTTNKALDQIFSRIVSQVRAQYSLGFVSSDGRKDGTWRKLDVRLLGDRLQNLQIRTRKGYYAAYTLTPPPSGKPRSEN